MQNQTKSKFSFNINITNAVTNSRKLSVKVAMFKYPLLPSQFSKLELKVPLAFIESSSYLHT